MSRLLVPCLALALLATGCNCGPADCPGGGGDGTLTVTFAGLPSGVAGKAALAGPGGATRTVTAAGQLSLPAGSWAVTPATVTQADPRVRTAFAGAANLTPVCVRAGGASAVTVTWTLIPTSHRAWFLNGDSTSGQLVAFTAEALADGGSQTASPAITGPAGRDVAFDRAGNLWALGPTTVDHGLVRFPARNLDSSGQRATDRDLDVAGVSCQPGLTGMAFDAQGNLYVSSACSHKVFKLGADNLEALNGTLTPVATLSDLTAPTGLAFDAQGNLYVADPDAREVVQYTAASLAGTSATAHARWQVYEATNPEAPNLLSPSWLAFDANGTLVGADATGGFVFTLPAGARGASGSVYPDSLLSLDVAALPEGLALDESGGVWLAVAAGQVGRISAAQLAAGGLSLAPATLLQSVQLGYAANVALFPGASGTPLHSALP